MTLNEFKLRYHVHTLPSHHRLMVNSPLTPAAVLLALQPINHELHLIFTRRPTHLRAHPGQISFPGGKVEQGDADLIATALREAEEEIGLSPENIEVIGRFPSQKTLTGFEITPVLGIVKSPFKPKLNSGEVAEYFTVPLSYLLNKAHRQVHPFSRHGHIYPVYFIPYRHHLIWGATASIIELLCQHLDVH
ncbi:CoA pyrophosphatase [Shewanella surugensis]|uniref:CoA pyrophosphatase n=1 Tax=Shewanella surugensis TaxID=212020 RepID=A0ABT0LIQ9_9GAMM|nr:CoA pyrophosphatase [Shewanella surugensis]MCL1127588.1 CoA pyrophosphatase [Shewanella surugensis]